MDTQSVKDFAIIVGGLVTVLAFLHGLLEYRRQGAERRMRHFLELRRRMKENQAFKEICALLATDSPELLKYDPQSKRDFAGFLEEVALLVEAGLLQVETAHYMFGWYVVRCLDSRHFWAGLEPDGAYWDIFRKFGNRLKEREVKLTCRN